MTGGKGPEQITKVAKTREGFESTGVLEIDKCEKDPTAYGNEGGEKERERY